MCPLSELDVEDRVSSFLPRLVLFFVLVKANFFFESFFELIKGKEMFGALCCDDFDSEVALCYEHIEHLFNFDCGYRSTQTNQQVDLLF